jgi:ribosome modulation factor
MGAETYYQGYWMALDGCSRDANPHAEEARRRNWDEGWQDAQEEGRISDR